MTNEQIILLSVAAYFLVISVFAVFVTRRDKSAAKGGKWRVKEATLLTVALFGGAVAMLITMRAIRHKTNRAKFMIGIPLIILLHAAAITVGLLYYFSVL